MSLKDKAEGDRLRVFQNSRHFADIHTWNGIPFLCVTDEETALKRKNNNVVDVSWDNNTSETVVYVREEDFPGRIQPNEHGFLTTNPLNTAEKRGHGNGFHCPRFL